MLDERHLKTVNKTIVDYVIECIKAKEMNLKTIALINHMRIYKHMILPCELLGLMGCSETQSFKNVPDKSYFTWKIPFLIVPKPSSKSIEYWKDFI